ncbi:TLDc domain-containing protein [Geopyxis carbonaria]|nr:TLDc domain-containing protein [Geopyxis carbonaria]
MMITAALWLPFVAEIRLLLPPRLQLHDTWTLAYSLETHGVSLATLYERGRARGSHGSPCVLVVRDSLGGMFGAFANEAFRPSGGRYYGTGECFLWKATQLGGGDGAVRFKAFPYSGVNDYMMLCDAHSLSVGGGDDGRYGLWLDDTLAKGVSARCETFGNEPLSESGGGKFEILDVELWMVGPVGS